MPKKRSLKDNFDPEWGSSKAEVDERRSREAARAKAKQKTKRMRVWRKAKKPVFILVICLAATILLFLSAINAPANSLAQLLSIGGIFISSMITGIYLSNAINALAK
jgi:uncharacterized membrane protein (DUF485 family)